MGIPIVIGSLGTVTKELVLWLEDLDIRSQLEKTCCYSDSSERPSANIGVKNLQGIIIIRGWVEII